MNTSQSAALTEFADACALLRLNFPASNFQFRSIVGGFELRIPDGVGVREWCAVTPGECAFFALEEMA